MAVVAIKAMRKSRIDAMGLRRSVERELSALRRCNGSPFVCQLCGAFQNARWAYLLLEPVPAGDLAGLLEQRGVMFEGQPNMSAPLEPPHSDARRFSALPIDAVSYATLHERSHVAPLWFTKRLASSDT